MTLEMEKREYFPNEDIGSQNYDSDTPIYAVVDKTRTCQESPQRIQGEECKNIKEDDREDGDDNEDMISLYAEVDKIKPANASPQGGVTKNLVLENEDDGEDLWSCQGGYSMVGKDFIHTASLQTAPDNPDPHNTMPELSTASSVKGVKFYYKHVSLKELIFIIVTLILVILVALTVSFAVISTKIKSIEDKIKTNTQQGSNNDDHVLPFLNYNQTIEMIKNLFLIINERLDRITIDNSHLLTQVRDSINMHHQTLVSLEERVRNQMSLVSSCADLLRRNFSAPSGLYWMRSSSGTGVQVYCDMNRTCGNITGGWMRVADISVSANSDSCPGELYQIGSSNHYGCKIETPNSASSSLFFSTHNTRYSHICGEVTAYQMGSLKAFNRLSAVDTSDELSIDMSYVNGISITHGCPRKHIWTFAAAHTGQGQSSCPCNDGHQPPSFVGNDYTCDLGCNPRNIDNTDYYHLWEGSSCDFYPPCCSNSRVPFFKLLSQPTTDYIELRVMHEVNMNEDILIDNINILVQ